MVNGVAVSVRARRLCNRVLITTQHEVLQKQKSDSTNTLKTVELAVQASERVPRNSGGRTKMKVEDRGSR